MAKASRWAKGAIRYSNERKVDNSRWVKNKRGQWRYKEDECSEHSFVNQRMHQQPAGFHRGARVHRVAPQVGA